MSMKVILIQDVPSLGKRGEIVDVADGYARNYLVPRNKAVKATDKAIAQADSMRRAAEESARRLKADPDQVN